MNLCSFFKRFFSKSDYELDFESHPSSGQYVVLKKGKKTLLKTHRKTVVTVDCETKLKDSLIERWERSKK